MLFGLFVCLVGLAAAATISPLPVVVLFVALQRYFVEGIADAVKS
ncbi:hypothetical protein ACIBO2_44900 [Nonomuraea sp. NPDC050022]